MSKLTGAILASVLAVSALTAPVAADDARHEQGIAGKAIEKIGPDDYGMSNHRILICEGKIEPRQDLAGVRIVKALRTGDDGTFACPLPPGDYTVLIEIAKADGDTTEVVIDGESKGDGAKVWPVTPVKPGRFTRWEFRLTDGPWRNPLPPPPPAN